VLHELLYCKNDCFEFLLNFSSKHKPPELKIVALYNGTFRKTKGIKIIENIVLIFLPIYIPKLNPVEKTGWIIKQEFTFKTFEFLQKKQFFMQSS